MNCPACDHPLTSIQSGRLTVEACQGGCGGLWLDNFELRRVDEPGEIEGEPLLDIPFSPEIHVDYSRRRNCPKCEDVVLMRHFFSNRREVEIDTCPNCNGVWLDAGELARIRQLTGTREDRNEAARRYFAQVFQEDFMRTVKRGPGSGMQPS